MWFMLAICLAIFKGATTGTVVLAYLHLFTRALQVGGLWKDNAKLAYSGYILSAILTFVMYVICMATA